MSNLASAHLITMESKAAITSALSLLEPASRDLEIPDFMLRDAEENLKTAVAHAQNARLLINNELARRETATRSL